VLRRIEAKACRRSGNRFSFRHVFTDCRRSFYLRLRGTNTPVVAPQIDPPDIDPWTDLWFYGNPIFVMVKR